MKSELVFIPFPAYGHITTAVENAKLLLSRDERLSVTVLIIKLPFDTGIETYAKSLHALTSERLCFLEVSPDNSASYSAVPESPMSFVSSYLESQRTNVREAVLIRSQSSRLAGFVVDMLCTAMIDVANELKVPAYVFFTTSAALLGLFFHLQSLTDHHGLDVTEYKDTDPELSVPSFLNPVPVKVLPSVVFNKSGGSQLIISAARRLRETKGIMLNTFAELETHALMALAVDGCKGKVPHLYPVGPVLDLKANQPGPEDPVIKWLDDQPDKSVVFLCFGTMGCFDEDQIKEIARGLEQSGHRFLWSLRQLTSPGEVPGEYKDPSQVLPEGFLERTARTGKVIGWAPQVAVLSHMAVGGFVSHCGWNSILESMWCGVPMATWPLYAEHQLSAFEMVKEWGMGVEIRLDYRKDFLSTNNTVEVVTGEEVEAGIRGLMEEGGSEVRKKVAEMMKKSRVAMEEGGSSYTSIGYFIEDVLKEHA
ncbi:hypothetical protein LguiB_025804 [Lonicera macranthoides]